MCLDICRPHLIPYLTPLLNDYLDLSACPTTLEPSTAFAGPVVPGGAQKVVSGLAEGSRSAYFTRKRGVRRRGEFRFFGRRSGAAESHRARSAEFGPGDSDRRQSAQQRRSPRDLLRIVGDPCRK